MAGLPTHHDRNGADVLESALAYRSMGLSVIPVDPNTKRALVPWKRFQEKPPELDRIREIWQRNPRAGIGVVTGVVSKLVVVDIDDSREEALREVEERFGEPGRISKTPRGFHCFYRPNGQPVPTVTKVEGFSSSVDLRGEGGYAIVPPTPGYQWLSEEGSLSDLPVIRSVPTSQAASRQFDWACDSVGPVIPKGRRNDQLTRVAGCMRWGAMEETEILAGLEAVNRRCDPPLSEPEVGTIAASAAKYEPKDPRLNRLSSSTKLDHKLLDLTFHGETLRATRERTVRLAPIPDLMDPSPRLHVINGKPETGKTSFALFIAQRWALGIPPWEGGRPLPGSRVLIVSREQGIVHIDGLLRRFGESLDPVWEDRVHIIARDEQLAPPLAPLLTLDDEGIERFDSLLREARDAGDPIGLVILDSLSRLKPPNVEENLNDQMSPWLDRLDGIAQEQDAHLILIHHEGHGREHAPREPRSAGRGASAIGAVSAVQMLIDRVRKNPRQRIVRSEGNFILGGEMVFSVCDPEDPPNAIRFFHPVDPFASYHPGDYLKPREPISTNQLAWALSKKPPKPGKNPPGSDTKLANQLRGYWAGKGLVEVFDGARGAKMIRSKDDLASSPGPRSEVGAKSGNPTSPTPPIEAGGGARRGGVPGAETAPGGGRGQNGR